MSDAAFDATAAATTAHIDCVERNQIVAHSRAASDAANRVSVMGMDCRYNIFGFRANSSAAATPAAVERYKRRAAANRNEEFHELDAETTGY